MTVSNNYAPVVTAANGVTTVFTASWNALAAANVVVQLLNTTTGVYTPVTQGPGSTQYQVTTLTTTSLVITFNTAPASGNNVVLSRNTAQTQTIPYTTSRGFQGSIEENSFDALTNMVQELNDLVVNSIQVSVGDQTANLVLPIASLRANFVLAFDASGNVIVSTQTLAQIQAGSTSAAASAVAAAASATAASGSATSASGSATSAATSATAAAAAAVSANYYNGTIAGTTSALTLTTGQGLTAIVAGQRFRGKATLSNAITGATLAVDTATAATIYKDGTAGALIALAIGDIATGVDAEFYVIDTTHIQLLNPLGEYKAQATLGTASQQVANMNAVMLSQFGGFQNGFRNGTMDIWQRGTSGTVATGNVAYTADGWAVGATGATVNWAQVTNSAGSINDTFRLQLTGNTSMTATFVRQTIESYIAQKYAGNQVTVTGTIQNSTGATITPTLTISHAGSLDNWGAPVTDVSAVNLVACPNNAFTPFSYTFACNASSYLGLRAQIDFGAALNANTKSVAVLDLDIRVTPGVASGLQSWALTTEKLPYPIQLAFNQRYLFTNRQAVNGGSSIIMLGWCADATHLEGYINLPVPMRVTPSSTLPALANVGIYPGNQAPTALAAANYGVPTVNTFTIYATVASGMTVGGAGIMRWNGTADAVTLSAELSA